jgi:hypothetical protein
MVKLAHSKKGPKNASKPNKLAVKKEKLAEACQKFIHSPSLAAASLVMKKARSYRRQIRKQLKATGRKTTKKAA